MLMGKWLFNPNFS